MEGPSLIGPADKAERDLSEAKAVSPSFEPLATQGFDLFDTASTEVCSPVYLSL